MTLHKLEHMNWFAILQYTVCHSALLWVRNLLSQTYLDLNVSILSPPFIYDGVHYLLWHNFHRKKHKSLIYRSRHSYFIWRYHVVEKLQYRGMSLTKPLPSHSHLQLPVVSLVLTDGALATTLPLSIVLLRRQFRFYKNRICVIVSLTYLRIHNIILHNQIFNF
jgi:hypothetical protein